MQQIEKLPCSIVSFKSDVSLTRLVGQFFSRMRCLPSQLPQMQDDVPDAVNFKMNTVPINRCLVVVRWIVFFVCVVFCHSIIFRIYRPMPSFMPGSCLVHLIHRRGLWKTEISGTSLIAHV